MRIIGGEFKGKRMQLPKGSKTRPTTDFAKEALFNYLGTELDFVGLTAIDLFAGSGGIGLEFLSRGAEFVYWVEIDSRNCSAIKNIAKELNAENTKVIKADAHKIIEVWKAEAADVVFLDAPFTFKKYLECATKIANSKMCRPDTLVVIEHMSNIHPFKNIDGCTYKKYGQIMFSIFNASVLQNG